MSKKKMTRYEKQMKKFLDQKRMKGGTRRAVEISIEGRKMALWSDVDQIVVEDQYFVYRTPSLLIRIEC